MLRAHIDFEGGAPASLKKVGLHQWMAHPAVQCWCMSWRLGSVGPVNRWHPGDPAPEPLLAHVRNGGLVVAHNASFERNFWNGVIRRKYAPEWPALRLEQQDCTLARCSALSLPAGLDDAGFVLGTTHQKDKAGGAIMLKMASPSKAIECPVCDGAGCQTCGGVGQLYAWEHSTRQNRQTLGAYCDDDVRAETDLDDRLNPLSERERRVWLLDQTINDRGVKFDLTLVSRARAVVEYAKVSLHRRINQLTNGAVPKGTQVAKLKAWIAAQGVPITSLSKGHQEEIIALADVLDQPDVAEAITIRRQIARSSTAKLDKINECVGADWRARGLLFYHGAHTGRWAGRLIQPQNLYRVDAERDGRDIEIALEILLTNLPVNEMHDRLEAVLGEPMTMVAKSMRSTIIAEHGKKLVGCDLSNIEGCANAWSSGEEWKIQAYRDYQAGNGPDLYRVAYGRSFGIPVSDVTSYQRQLGKVEELALGYQGSVGAFYTFTQTYLMKLTPIVLAVRAAVDAERWEKARWLFHKMPAMRRYGLPEDVWVACKIIVDGWREAHPATCQSWWDLQDAAIEAMMTPTVPVSVLDGKIRYMASPGMLWCQLPSGRLLAYPKPLLKWQDNSTVTLQDGTVLEAADLLASEVDQLIKEGADYKQKLRRVVLYYGFDDDTGWHTKALYGGLQSENVNSGIARDILVDGMFDAEAAGYPIVLTVHDEVLAEPWAGHGSAKELQAIMSQPRRWCPGFPLAAKAWEGQRYGK